MQAAFARILNMSLTGSIVIAVVLLARLFLKRAPKIYSYALWAVVLFRLLCPLSITAGLSVLKPIPVPMRTTPGVSSVDYQPVQQALSRGGYVPAVQQQPVSDQESEQAEPEMTALQIAAYVWLAGASVMAIYSVVQYLTLRHRLVGAAPYREEIYLADHITTPFVLGVLRPRVYLPSETPEGERAFIIAHERHHIRRHDPLWKLLGYAALCLHWFNPLVWLAFALAGKDMEMSCDEAVIRHLGEDVRAEYSQALLRLATHKRIVSGMPLAFGEGDTKGRVMNMAKWKKPKVWVSVLCVALCLVILAACALNPKQEETETDGETQIVGPARIVIRDLRFRIPAGCITEKMEKKIHEQTDDGLDVAYWEFADGESIIGGVNTFRIPEDFSADNWDWLHELDLPEWQDETLGYSAGGAPVDKVIVEFFSDVPEGQERTVLNEHNLYFYDGWIYDLWFDKLTVKPEVMEAILDSVSAVEEKTIPVVDMPYKILEMPAGGYDYRTEADGSISFLKEDNIIGGIVAYPIPEGVYDPYDDAYLWLEDVGIPDLEDPNLYVAGVFSWKGSSSCALTVEDDFQNPTVKRTHYFQIAGNMLYDFWLDDLNVDENARSAIEKAVVYQEPVTQQSGTAPESEMSEEEKAFSKCQAVMMGLQDSVIRIFTVCQYQNTPEKNWSEDFTYSNEIGFLRMTTSADGTVREELYAFDRYFTSEADETTGLMNWTEAEPISERRGPWLGNFNFIRHYVTYVDTLSDTEKTSYLFRVDAPFEDREDATPYYFVSFDFDSEGNFLSVYLQINPAQDNAYTLTESIVSTDEQAIVTKIDQEYQRAIG